MADISIRFSSSEVSPIFMIRLVAESGGIMKGGLAQVGSDGVELGDALGDQLTGASARRSRARR